ncbi:hypothetical protein [Algoriphagus sediminis]|uniref:Uncharacterized protein n=1 Tax=Algoriphagus sediminis TaxID=3057113 RepID=A0ABT7YGV8_9BACT|nr:hypothetical protein [Algoriphagus sediminis]MDN3205772.1 hypothetical protein [Algoriphagus sediminis]
MAKPIFQYFKRKLKTYEILVQVNPEDFTGTELIVHPDGKIEKTEMEFDEEIFEDLAEDDFIHASALEFQMLLSKAES